MVSVNSLNNLNNVFLPGSLNTQRTGKSSDNFFINTTKPSSADEFKKNENLNAQLKAVNTSPSQSPFDPKSLLKNYTNTNYIKFLIKSNPELQEILTKNNLNGVINPQNVSDITESHLETTNQYAQQIADKMGLSQAEKQLLEQASYFHDFGKALIPDEILNKPGALSPEERQIMNLHAELGYQLLKNTKLTKRVQNIIRNHHKPTADNPDILGQIISVADVYSALKEKRCYKPAMSTEKAYQILDEKVKNGELSLIAVQALKESQSEEQKEAA